MNSRGVSIALCFFAFVLIFTKECQAKIIYERINLVYLGEQDKNLLDEIKNKLPVLLPMPVGIRVIPPEEMPESAYDPARKQYNAETVVREVSRRIGNALIGEYNIIVTDADLYSSGFDFTIVFVDYKSKACIISSARLKNEFYGAKPDNRTLYERVLKQALYGIGQCLGLVQCPDLQCAMHFSNDLPGVDAKKKKLCRKCRNTLYKKYNKPLLDVPIKPLF